jgi:hypothetical protein
MIRSIALPHASIEKSAANARHRPKFGMVQKRPFSGNTRDLGADPDRSRIGAGLRESLAAVLGLQFRENRVYPGTPPSASRTVRSGSPRR